MTLAVASRNFGLSRVNPKKSIKLSISECEYFSSSCRTYPETLEGIKLMLPKNKKSFSSQVKHIAQDPPNYVTQGRVLPLLSDLKLFSMCMTNSARTSQRNLTKKNNLWVWTSLFESDEVKVFFSDILVAKKTIANCPADFFLPRNQHILG